MPLAYQLSMVGYIRSAVALVGFGGAFCLLVAISFMPSELRPLVLVFASLLFGLTWPLVMIVNKPFLGVYLPGPRLTPAERQVIRQTARKDRPLALLSGLCILGVNLPLIFLMKEFGWSRNSVLVVGLVASVIMVVIFSRVNARYRRENS